MGSTRHLSGTLLESMFIFDPNPNLELDEYLSNLRWKEQNEILVFVEKLIFELLAGAPSIAINNLTLKKKKDWLKKKSILLALMDTKEFKMRME